MRQKYERNLEQLQEIKNPNDLNSIFQNCRELFLNNVVQYRMQEDDETEFDFKEFKFVKTGKKIFVQKAESGAVVKDENGKAVFQKRTLEKRKIPIDFGEL